MAYFSVRTVFPFVDHKLRLPDAVSIVITYALAAYVLVPAFIRLYRIIWPPDHLPLYCVTPDGFASDPLNIGVIGARRELIIAMEKAGWYLADRHSFKNMARVVLYVVLSRRYKNAPISSLYLFGRKQDLAFELPVKGEVIARHHVRFWATTYVKKEKLSIRSIHWHHRKKHIYDDNLLWVGAASLDIGLSFIRHNLQVTHMIEPDTNQERQLIVDGLKAQKLVKKVETIKLGEAYKLINRVFNGFLHTDGKMSIIHLK